MTQQHREWETDEVVAWEYPELRSKPLKSQVGGKHYLGCKIQPIEFIEANEMSFAQGSVVKYITRYKNKNGAEDIRKAIHYCEIILAMEYGE